MSRRDERSGPGLRTTTKLRDIPGPDDVELWEFSGTWDPAKLPPRPERGVRRIELDSTPVRVRGDALDEVWWRGKQWAVTEYGIERLDGGYTIEAADLPGDPNFPWPMHMSGKRWVEDIDEFTTAWMVAVVLHGKAAGIDAKILLPLFGRLRPRPDQTPEEPHHG
jgi:hypothetical protein